MTEHPFTSEREQRIEDGIEALRELGYITATIPAQAALDEQRRARQFRIAAERS